MKTNVFLGIGLRIVILFTVGMFMTYLPEHLTEFFGDTIHKCETSTCWKTDGEAIWGSRHYWYNTMMILLFLLALLNVIFSIKNLVNKNYDTTKW